MYLTRWRLALGCLSLILIAQSGQAAAETPDEMAERVLARIEIPIDVSTIAKRALARARRAYVVGPYLASGGTIGVDGGGGLMIAGGIGITKFDISILPSRNALLAIVRRRARGLVVKQLAAAAVTGKRLSDDDVRQAAEQAIREVEAELLLKLEPKRFEKPGLALRVEGGSSLDTGAVDLRIGLGIGVSKVMAGTGIVLKINDGGTFYLPLEVSVPMALTRGARSHLLDFFARYELALSSRDERSDLVTFGARLHLDII